jgi:hypothetical protein
VSEKLKQRAVAARKRSDDQARKLEKTLGEMDGLKPNSPEWKKAKARVDEAKAEYGRLSSEYVVAAQEYSESVGGKQLGPK